jgi:maltooligosyltrehalose trehalohydrolase
MSQVVDPAAYRWNDSGWKGLSLPGQVIYELHIGCFTPDGTWRSAEDRLGFLVETGITVVEVMPVAEFPGEFGWGYDGVQWFAPTRNYGTPDDFRHFVDAAHALGLGVILDVVYNHFGPTGNYAGVFTDAYFSKRHPTEWGAAINYDGEGAEGVRELVTSNAAYWIDEFHLDGLRLDATQAIFDDSPRHVVADLGRAARAAADGRSIIIVAENDDQEIRHVEPPEQGGFGLDGVWNDDFHHAVRVAATGHAEFYYADYTGSVQELLSATQGGYLYQGQYAAAAGRFRGTPALHVPTWRFVHCLENHDQVANSGRGERWSRQTSPGRRRALTALWLLGPATPMFFMGQEFGADSGFLFFADHEPEIAELVRRGRWEFLRRFARVASWRELAELPEPGDRRTFEACRLDWSLVERQPEAWKFHRDLLRLRREDPAISRQDRGELVGSIVTSECLLLRWDAGAEESRLLLVNLGRDLELRPTSEPLLAPPLGRQWRLLFSSEALEYGGGGTAELDVRRWTVPGHTALLLRSAPPAEGESPPVGPAAGAAEG